MDARKRTPGERIVSHVSAQIRKKLKMLPSEKALDPYLTAKELIFRVPPLTPELMDPMRLLSPQFHLRAEECSRRFWELNQNGLCWGEYEALKPFLESLGTPSRVPDIGPGLGRFVVFFKKILGWEMVPFDLYESTGSSTKYTKAGPRFDDSFCGNLGALEVVLSLQRHRKLQDHRCCEDRRQAHGTRRSLSTLSLRLDSTGRSATSSTRY